MAIAGRIVAAWAELGAGRYTEATAIFDKLGEDGLADFLVFHRALLAEAAGRAVEAERFARTAYEGDRLVPRIIEAYARILGNAGRYDRALEVLDAYRDQGYNHAVLTPVREAVEARTPPGPFARNVQAGAAEMLHSIGVALAREGGRETALVFLQLGRYLDPRSDVIALVIGQLYDGADNHTAANALYDRIPAASPLKPTAVIRAAENFDSMGDRTEAIRRLSNIVVANPDNLDALSVLGDLQRTDERYADAAKTYSEVLRLAGGNHPADWRYYYVRGISYERNKEWEKAEADFKRALELNPNQPQVLNYLGYSWVDQGTNLLPALDMIQRAVAAAPNDGYIIDSLGWAYYRLGRFEEAVKQLELAVQLRSTDPEINDHLGDAYWRAGRQLEARFQWNIASSVDKEGAVKERVAIKLQKGLDAAPPSPDAAPVAETPAAPAE
jgi:tetratricopeptide (TPR) repeat protein